MTYDEWEREAAIRLGKDRVWRMRAYRLGCYAAEMAWPDAEALLVHPLTRDVAPQLMSALGSIRANLAEGYSRSAGRDRARIFEYALGSARESREWYLQAVPVLGAEHVAARCAVLDEIIRMLLAIIPRERDRKIVRAEEAPPPRRIKQRGGP
jgi:four helix bundle protein